MILDYIYLKPSHNMHKDPFSTESIYKSFMYVYMYMYVCMYVCKNTYIICGGLPRRPGNPYLVLCLCLRRPDDR